LESGEMPQTETIKKIKKSNFVLGYYKCGKKNVYAKDTQAVCVLSKKITNCSLPQKKRVPVHKKSDRY